MAGLKNVTIARVFCAYLQASRCEAVPNRGPVLFYATRLLYRHRGMPVAQYTEVTSSSSGLSAGEVTPSFGLIARKSRHVSKSGPERCGTRTVIGRRRASAGYWPRQGFCQHMRQLADTSRREYAPARFRGMKRDAVSGMSINGRQASV